MNWRSLNRIFKRHWPKRKLLAQWLRHWPAIVACGFVSVLWALGAWQGLEQSTYSPLLRSRGSIPWDDRVVIVAIDQKSLDALGYFPWKRDRYTQLLEQLDRAQPNVVAFDLVFSEPTPADPALAKAMANHRRVVLAQAWSDQGNPWQPTPLLQENALSLGHISDSPDPDGKLRRLQPWIGDKQALSYAAFQAYRLFGPELPNLNDPLRESNLTVWVNWTGPMQRIPQYSFVDVMSGQVPRAQLANKIIFVGVTAPGMNPITSPFDLNRTSGVHLHATVLNQLLQGRPLRRLDQRPTLLLFPLLTGLFYSFLWWRRDRGEFWGVAIALFGSGVLWLAIVWGAFCLDWWLPLFAPMGLLGLTALLFWLDYGKRLEVSNLRLGHLVNYDDLTQVANRRYFDQHLKQEWSRMVRERSPMALLLCDVDFFKRYNDHQGHLAGDSCLRQVALAIHKSLKRPADVVARYGGEEFVVILPNTDLAGALQLSREVLETMHSLQIPHGDSPIAPYVTLSIGVASCLPELLNGSEKLVADADRALYKAKHRGRDQVSWHYEAPASATLDRP
jgi:adenylate cyclase